MFDCTASSLIFVFRFSFYSFSGYNLQQFAGWMKTAMEEVLDGAAYFLEGRDAKIRIMCYVK